jgi:hypothetical protein
MKRLRIGAAVLAVAGLCLVPATAASASGGFFPYSAPGTPALPSYTGISCAIDLSGIPDGTPVTSVTGCGVTVSFSVTMYKVSIGNGWATWGSPPDTESGSIAVLRTFALSSVTLTYHTPGPVGAGRRTVGVEAEGDAFVTENFTATFTGSAGTDGTITRDIDGFFGARLLGARTKTIAKVQSLTITNNSGDDFAIGEIRV